MEKNGLRILLTEFKKVRKMPLKKVLFSLGIRHVGETVSKRLVKIFLSIDNLVNSSLEDLIEIDDIGPKIAKSLVEYFSKEENINLVQQLKSHNLFYILFKKMIYYLIN